MLLFQFPPSAEKRLENMIAELTGELMVELVRSSFPPGTIFSKEIFDHREQD
jgi:hypothetical protein